MIWYGTTLFWRERFFSNLEFSCFSCSYFYTFRNFWNRWRELVSNPVSLLSMIKISKPILKIPKSVKVTTWETGVFLTISRDNWYFRAKYGYDHMKYLCSAYMKYLFHVHLTSQMFQRFCVQYMRSNAS